jgi:hypothetical protein
MVFRLLFLILALSAAAAAPAQTTPTPAQRAAAEAQEEAQRRALERWTSPTLTRFTGESEFRRYARAVREHPDARPRWWARGRHIQFAQGQAPAGTQTDAQPPLCPPENPDCMASGAESIVLTGSRARSNSITNNQEAGVDEGDIVKQIGQYLLVLQDGRIFVIDTRGGDGSRLVLSDRTNVYRDAAADMWYDEMLVEGDHVLVTGYSYADEATEVSVFRLDVSGRLARRGVFFLSSNDYYDSDNYATRLVGDNLVVYAPMEVSEVDPDEPIKWPLVRRWVAGEDRAAGEAHGIPLFDARNIYRPVRTVTNPYVHTVSVCPLGPVGAGRDLRCRTTAFVGPGRREYYLSPTDAYLWLTPGDDDLGDEAWWHECPAGTRVGVADSIPRLVYRIPISGEEPGVLGTVGTPIDQFSLAASESRFRALLALQSRRCSVDSDEGPPLVYFNALLARFGDTLAPAPLSSYTPLPAAGARSIENRFTDAFLVYSGRSAWRSSPPAPGEEARTDARVVAVPINRPRDAAVMHVPHDVIRAERAGDDIVLTGYRDHLGLQVSLIALNGAPRVGSTARLDGRYESEGRSHAFNSLMERDGSGIMGLPTVRRDFEAGRYAWRSDASDLSYLTADAGRRLAPAGELLANEDADEGTGYRCEVSCIDWYGNSRPIFTDGRVFGLSGVELIEGRLDHGRVVEVQRLNIAGAQPRR